MNAHLISRSLSNRLAALVAALAVCAAFPANAQPTFLDDPGQVANERARIAAERRAVQANFASEQEQCYQRFAVNDCLRESRAKRRSALSALRGQEIVLNDAERKRKAAEQQLKIDQKALERSRRAATRAPAASEATEPAAVDHGNRSQPAAASSANRRAGPKEPLAPRRSPRADEAEKRRAESAAARAERASEAEASAARHEEKLKEAAEHKAKVLRENAEKKAPAAPLPPPPGAPVN